MTIVRSGGVATLVALMSAHRSAAGDYDALGASFDQARIEATLAYLRGETHSEPGQHSTTEHPRSYN
jgi:hypothetical protein